MNFIALATNLTCDRRGVGDHDDRFGDADRLGAHATRPRSGLPSPGAEGQGAGPPPGPRTLIRIYSADSALDMAVIRRLARLATKPTRLQPWRSENLSFPEHEASWSWDRGSIHLLRDVLLSSVMTALRFY